MKPVLDPAANGSVSRGMIRLRCLHKSAHGNNPVGHLGEVYRQKGTLVGLLDKRPWLRAIFLS